MLKRIANLFRRLNSLEKKFIKFENRLNDIDNKYSATCNEQEPTINAIDLNMNKIRNLASEIQTTMNFRLDNSDKTEAIFAVKHKKLLRKIADLEREQIVREFYDKRLNILIHGLEEKENENKQRTKVEFETFLPETLKLESDSGEVVDLHRLPQRQEP